MPRTIAPVDPKLLIAANDVVSKDTDKSDPSVMIIMALADKHDADELLAVTYRLQALARIVRDGGGSIWVRNLKGKKYKLVNEAMYRAAARAPLSIDENEIVANLAFDTDVFLKFALEESDTDGSA